MGPDDFTSFDSRTNEQLAKANTALQAEKTRELLALNTSLHLANRELERANRAAYVDLVNSVAAAQLVEQVAITGFASYQEAVSLRDGIADELDALAIRQADAGDDEGAATYEALRLALVTANARSLPPLMMGRPAARSRNMHCTCPPLRSCMAGALPRYGTN